MNKVKWVDNRDFRRFVGSSTTDLDKHEHDFVIHKSPYYPPSEHQYRKDEKAKWYVERTFV